MGAADGEELGPGKRGREVERKAAVLVPWGYRLACGGLGRTLPRTPGNMAEFECFLGWQTQNCMNSGVFPAEQLVAQGSMCQEWSAEGSAGQTHGKPQRARTPA